MSYELDGTETPWSYCELVNDDGHVRYSVEGRNGEEICVIDCDDYTAERDARAMASAPKLVEALGDALTDLIGYQVNARKAAKHDSAWEGVAEAVQPRIDKARAALAKATGEQ
ncbi:hypothetical protein SLPG_00062 [Salicola phage CGphi29]|uniref:hypothetical protein n=1 Tax=Salicola phage CGphi29 TaxID=754067 RepID=UPI0002C0A1A6|nr:hypothetical protein SLPG_00062 [Salicola phage CGphi29]AGH31856.1 hypothetical protein SLPG_00062 [Salicola phage CGphi29]